MLPDNLPQEQEIQAEEQLPIIPDQSEFYKMPTRFGHVPVDEAPLGWDKKHRFEEVYPRVSLPFQVVERVSFGHPALEPNRLFFGDNLHIMRMLPGESIDLIYIDPPFFSGRNYNVLFGDKNELRSFSDIWDGGLPGYLIWLNARLYEMKRLLKPTGSIYVHLDYHACHYVKIEMDKIFGYENFQSEIIWKRSSAHSDNTTVGNIHDNILLYSRGENPKWNPGYTPYDEEYKEKYYRYKDPDGRRWLSRDTTAPGGRGPVYEWKGITRAWRYTKDNMEKLEKEGKLFYTKNGIPRFKQYLDEMPGVPFQSIWNDKEVQPVNSWHDEAIGYPTQKSEGLLKRIIEASSNTIDIVADFFCGGGTIPTVAQKLGRRWIACDISRIAVALTADRLSRLVEEHLDETEEGKKTTQILIQNNPIPDFTIEHWGIYEVKKLTELTPVQFRKFVIQAYNGRPDTTGDVIHGYKDRIPLYVGSSNQDEPITKDEVLAFAKAIVTKHGQYKGTLLGWTFTPGAKQVVEQLEKKKEASLDFIKLSLIPIESYDFKRHVTDKHPEYSDLLTFVLPPVVRVGYKRVQELTYFFDISESTSMNSGGKIVNVQWDFSYGKRFSSTQGYSFLRGKKNESLLQAEYTFPNRGKYTIACRVQDDLGGEATKVMELEVS